MVLIAVVIMTATNYLLVFPFFGTDVNVVHIVLVLSVVVALLFVAVMLAHIYIGTIGMEGAVEAMWDGTVDLNWAKEHHSLWVEQEMHKDETARSPRPAATPAE